MKPYFVTLIALYLAMTDGVPVSAYSPESAEVAAMVNKALEFLERPHIEERYKETSDKYVGYHSLIGLVFLKNGRDESQPQVAQALQACQKVMKTPKEQMATYLDTYSNALAVMFLSELDPKKYKKELDHFTNLLIARQSEEGAWVYATSGYGDTSQTQYGMLALWSAQHVGQGNASDSIVRSAHWLLEAQAKDGGWGYHIGDEPTVSLTTASIGSLYVCCDFFGLFDRPDPGATGRESALKEVNDGPRHSKPSPGSLRVSDVKAAVQAGDKAFESIARGGTSDWYYYYLYALERYQSFRETSLKEVNPEPDWYNQGVKDLRDKQAADGSWNSPDESGTQVDTAFAILFLIRSTQKSLKENYGDGLLAGGRGLPSDVSTVSVKGGKVVSQPLTINAEDLLSALNDPDSENYDKLLSNPDQLMVISDEATTVDPEKLQFMLRRGTYQQRRLAIRILAKTRNLDFVPLLIFALTDPDSEVSIGARDALRFLSRKVEGVGLPDAATDRDRVEAAEKWKAWYLTIRPDAQFLD